MKAPLVVTRVRKVDAAVTNSSPSFVLLRCVACLLMILAYTWVPRAAASEAPATTTNNGSTAKAKKASTTTTKKRSATKAKKHSATKAKKRSAKKAKKRSATNTLTSSTTPGAESAAAPDQPAGVSLATQASVESTAPAAAPASSEREPSPAAEASPLAEAASRVEPPQSVPPGKRAHGSLTARAALETSGYLDTDHVSVVSPTIAVGLADEVGGWSVNGHYLVDVVSAASVDIVSTASPHWTEVRHAGGLSGSMPFEPVTVGASAVISREPDYLSVTGGATLSIDLLEKNLTPYFAFSREQDSIGRTDLPHEYWNSKHVTNLQVGLTAVLDRSTIGSIQWDGSFERGYLAKPYRYVPLFAPGQGSSIPAGVSIDEVNRLRLNQRPIEQVPSARDRYAVSGHLAHRFGGSTLRLDERLYTDNWGLSAATSELRFIMDLHRRLELWPHLRHHIQGQVRFWQRAYEAILGPEGSLGVPVFRTGNRELSPLQTIVLGGGMRLKLSEAPGAQLDLVFEADVGRTRFSDALYISERLMGYSTLAIEAVF
jgi:uncharacterized protein DUF3570